MTKKIFQSICTTVLIVAFVCFAILFGYSYNVYTEEANESLRTECGYMKTGYEAFGRDFFTSISKGDIRVSWISEDGEVLFDSRLSDGDTAENHIDREEIKEALEFGEGHAVRYSAALSERMVYFAVRAADGTVVRVSDTQSGALVMLFEALGPIFIIFLIASAVALLVARRLSVNIVRPINEIDLDRPEDARVYPELRPMVDKLSSQNYKIARQMSELKIREGEFNSITHNMNEGMVVINSRAVILSCNRSAKNIFGVSGDIPKSVLSLNDSQSFREAIVNALSGRNGYDVIKTEDKHYSVIASPVFHEGRVEGAVIVLIDDTEKEERESLRREFTSNVSHELKTPLTSISGFAELIASGMAEGEDARRFAGNIHKESKRLISLVGDIIRLSQLDGGEIPYDGKIELRSVVDDVVSRLSNIAEQVEVSISVSGEGVYTDGNRMILEEMIYNLCDNAVKYNNKGGRVEISVFEDGGFSLLRVKDNGIGIPSDRQDRVFERFYRVDKSHSKNIGGTGLGLSIVKHAAAYHKAGIELVSELGVGTEITVRFSPSALAESCETEGNDA